MRVQPLLPKRPLTATRISISGARSWAASAARRPAPPEARIRVSVFRVRTGAPPGGAAARGLGRAMAAALAEGGADVAVLGRRKDLVEETAKEIGKRGRRTLAAGGGASRVGDGGVAR